jgi:hypothetical protein
MSRSTYWLQKGAQEAGYYSGPLDGQWSPALSAALSRVLIARGQPLAPHMPFNGLETQSESSGA